MHSQSRFTMCILNAWDWIEWKQKTGFLLSGAKACTESSRLLCPSKNCCHIMCCVPRVRWRYFILCDQMIRFNLLMCYFYVNTPTLCSFTSSHPPSLLHTDGSHDSYLNMFLYLCFFSLSAQGHHCDSCHIMGLWHRESFLKWCEMFLMMVMFWLNYRKCVAVVFCKKSEKFSIINKRLLLATNDVIQNKFNQPPYIYIYVVYSIFFDSFNPLHACIYQAWALLTKELLFL